MGHSQSRFKVGAYYDFGGSNYYGKSANAMAGSFNPVFSIKPGMGLGALAKYELKENFGLTVFSGYQQRGAFFDNDLYTYAPQYKFNYVDFGLGFFVQTKEIIGKSKLYTEVVGTYHRLLNSERKNNYESFNLINDSKKSDFGALVNIGLQIPRHEVDAFQVALFSNIGFQNVFGGVLADNGQVGKNLVFGIKLGYLLGFKKDVAHE